MEITLKQARSFLGWCTVINFGFMLYWILILFFAHDFAFKMHTQWFKISMDKFDEIHYTMIAGYKLLVMFFNFIPYLILRLVKFD